MKTLLFALSVLCMMLGLASCEDMFCGGTDSNVYIYIAGEENKTVQISYLERGQMEDGSNDGSSAPKYVGCRNSLITQSVTLPFFKEVHYIGDIESAYDVFLEIVSENDSTTKAIIFDRGLLVENKMCRENRMCWVFSVWLAENAVDEYSCCRDQPKDSVLSYLKRTEYPCYLEFSKGDTRKKVMMRDYWKR
jgi:hypothetical protein